MQTRHEFLRTLLMTGLGATVLGACGSDGEPDPQPDANSGSGVDAGPADAFMGTCATTSVSIGSNHGHEMTVEPADLDSTSAKMYEIRGSSDHPHRVTITPAQFATLKTEGTLMVTSTENSGHPHSIRVRCTA
jgi:hypothetical protein